MNAPVGEVDDVVKDVKVLVNKDSEVLTAEKTSEILAAYNTARMTWDTAPDSQEPLIVSAHGQVDSTSFVNPGTGNVIQFDHDTRKFTTLTDQKQTLSENVEGYRSEIARAVRDYLRSSYTDGKAVSTTYGNDDGTITACISCKNVHLGNFWTGSLRSTYSLNVSSEGDVKMNGSVKLESHYFEDGNVQLHSDNKSDFAITVGDAKSTARAIASAISEFETSFQNSLEEIYVNMHRTTFKSMRRFYPPSGTFMTWNLAAHNVARTVGN
jgi:capping protein alpha